MDLKRFDFGVPLEDVFPPNDIHPRLQFLFKEAYQAYIESGLDISTILREYQGSLEQRLRLKESLIYDINYENLSCKLPGTYFWLIRHFLGLLPIPLMPKFADATSFDWESMSNECLGFMKSYRNQREKNYELEYRIAMNLNQLPFEHFLLMHVLINFIRKVVQNSPNNYRLDRRKLMTSARYFCGAIFSRPYRPGNEKQDMKMFPLLVFLSLRWKGIQKVCNKIGHPAYFLENTLLSNFKYKGSKEAWTQTYNFNPNIITVYRNVPCSCNEGVCLNDRCSRVGDKFFQKGDLMLSDLIEESVSSDFERVESIPIASSTVLLGDDGCKIDLYSSNNADCTFLTAQEKSLDPSTNPFVGNKLLTTQPHIRERDSEKIDHNSNKVLSNSLNNEEFSILSTKNSSEDTDWSNVMKEALEKAEKVEGYIYDDYETFSKEFYNQISSSGDSPSTLSKISDKMIRSCSALKNSLMSDKTTKPDNDSDATYVSFVDGVEDDLKKYYKADRGKTQLPAGDNSMNITFKSCYDSNEKLCSSRLPENSENDKSKTSFLLKRFKVKMDFLRIFTHRNTPRKQLHTSRSSSDVPYAKINDFKTNTF